VWSRLVLTLVFALTLATLPGLAGADAIPDANPEGIPEQVGLAALKRDQATPDSRAPGHARIDMVESSFDLTLTVTGQDPGRTYRWDVRVGDYCDHPGQGTSALSGPAGLVVADEGGTIRVDERVTPTRPVNEYGTQGIAVRVRPDDGLQPEVQGCGRVWGLPPGFGGTRHWW
jgi:hypothetical protein